MKNLATFKNEVCLIAGSGLFAFEAASFLNTKGCLKKIILFFVGKIHFKIVKSHFLAIRDFKAWNRIRFKDNGYNPFN